LIFLFYLLFIKAIKLSLICNTLSVDKISCVAQRAWAIAEEKCILCRLQSPLDELNHIARLRAFALYKQKSRT